MLPVPEQGVKTGVPGHLTKRPAVLSYPSPPGANVTVSTADLFLSNDA
jgi:hypothetical protein